MGGFGGMLVGIGFSCFMGLLWWSAQCGQPVVDRGRGMMLFRYSDLFRYVSLMLTVGAPVAFTALCVYKFPLETDERWALMAFSGSLSLFGVALLWESVRFWLLLSPEGLHCRSPWRDGRFIAWEDVTGLSYSRINKWFIIETADGWNFRVNIYVPGLAQLLQQFEQRLPKSSLRSARKGYLEIARPFPE